jgi:hypothetical protein
MQAAWLKLLLSSPVLLEATLAIGLRHWAPGSTWARSAEILASRSLRRAIRDIDAGEYCSDAALTAALTMAFGERLVHDRVRWNTHIDGAVQIIRARHQRGVLVASPMLIDILIWFVPWLMSL